MHVVLDANEGTCPLCGVRRQVQKTVARQGVSLALGRVVIDQTMRTCATGCVSGKVGRAPQLAALFPVRATVGYDVMVHVGLERFTRHRQRDEIRAALAGEGIAL